MHAAVKAIDPDAILSAALMPEISSEARYGQRPSEMAQWLDVLARSGTPLFVSAAPEAIGPEQDKALREAFAIASVPHKPAEPVDWMETMCPAVWAFDSGEVTYDWYEEFGAEPLMY